MDVPIVIDAHQRYLNQYPLLGRKGITVGMLALGLAVETHARIAERLGDDVFEVRIGSHVASSLRNALDVLGIRENVLSIYDDQVKMIRDQPDAAHGALLPDSDDSSVRHDELHHAPAPLTSALDRASLLAEAARAWPGEDSDLSELEPDEERWSTSGGWGLVVPEGDTPRGKSSSGPGRSFGDEGTVGEG